MTAAHCVSDDAAAPAGVPVTGSTVTARVGASDRTTGTLVTGEAVYLHPDWAWGMPTGKPVSDLALVKLTKPAGKPLMPIGGRQVRESGAVRPVGWGLTHFPPPPGLPPADAIPTMLQERDATRVADSVCTGGFIGAGEVCVSPASCFGDSGGPLLRPVSAVRHGERRWATVGITSRGTTTEPQCVGPRVYTDPTYLPFRRWMLKTMLNPKPNPKVGPCICPPTPYTATDSTRVDQFTPLIT